jgi:hypothetical protein
MRDATAFRVSSQRRYWLTRGVAAGAFAVVCAASLRRGSGPAAALGVAGLLLFGSLALYALRQGLRTRPRLTLDATGFDAPDLGVGPIAWSEVEHVQVFGSREAPFIAFHVRDPAAFAARMPPWPRVVQRVLRAQGLPAFAVNLIGVDRDPADIAEWAKAWWSDVARP